MGFYGVALAASAMMATTAALKVPIVLWTNF
jgi:hypothetical protein